MIQKEYSVTRTRSTWKPRVCDDDLPFFRCPNCGNIVLGVTNGDPTETSGTGRSLVAELPFKKVSTPVCCDAPMEPVEFVAWEDCPEGVELDYQFWGGFNNNCVKIKWDLAAEYQLDWVALKTFTGTQTKYLVPGKRSPLVFAFAAEDAFCYCDKSPCEECVFRCKRGFIAYCMVRGLGLVRIPLDRMVVVGS